MTNDSTAATRRPIRNFLAGAAWLALACHFAAPAAAQDSREINFSIAAQPLADALMQLSRQAGVDIAAPSELTRGRAASAVSGALTTAQALERLLDGSGLSFRRGRGDSYVIEQAGSSSTGEFDAGQGPAERASVALEPEEIIVTGTHIRSADKPVGGQLITIDRKDIQRSGFSTIRDLSEALPQNFGSGATGEFQLSADSGNNTAMGSTFNLRGLGQTATLNLVNGRRVPTGGANATISDISTVPLVAIERVEVLSDGASALYGSDAVAGVVNVILRSDFEGQETTARYGFTTQRDSLDEFQFSHAAGTAWDTGSTFISYEFYHRDHLLRKDRPYSESKDLRPFGGGDYRIPYGSPGNILTPAGGLTVLYALPSGQNGQNLTRGDLLPPSAADYYNYWGESSLFPRKRQHSLFGYLHQEVSESTEFYFEGRYVNRKNQEPRSAPNITAIIPPTNPYYFDAYGTGQPIRVAYSLGETYTPQRNGTVSSYSAVAGVNISHSGNWATRSYVAYSEDRIRDVYGTFSLTGIEAASNSSDPATALNPFGDGLVNGPGVLKLIADQNHERIRARTVQANIVSDGPLFNLFGRTLRGAVGADYRHERSSRDGENNGGPYVSNAFTREVIALFGEVRAPIVGRENALPGIKRLDLSFSLRYDRYKDAATRPSRKKRPFQSTTNPRVGLSWSPVESLQFNGSYGTSFRAPRLDTLTTVPSVGSVTYRDSSSPTGQSYVLVMSGVDPDIKHETADTWSFGAEISPPFAPQARLQINYFNIDFRDQVGQPPHPESLLNDARLADLVIRNPSLEQIQAACGTADPSQRPSDPLACTTGAGIAVIVDNRTTNLARTTIDGIDVQASYMFKTQSLGQLGFSVNATRLFNFEQAITANSPMTERKNTPTYPVKFRARGNVNWSPSDAVNLSLFANYSNNYRDPGTGKKIDAWTTIDLTANYNTRDRVKSRWLQNLTLQFSVQNLFDQDPPFYDSSVAAGYDYANADPLGRLISFTIKKAW